MMYLKEDALSSVKSWIIHARKGDRVKLISDHGHVLIVEGPDGKKFSVLASKVTEDFIAPSTEPENKKEIIHRTPARKKEKPRPVSPKQQKLL